MPAVSMPLPLRLLAGVLPASSAILLCSCAIEPARIAPQSVSAERYIALSCAELATESSVVASRMQRLRSKIESSNEVTEGATGIVGWAVFWPEILYHRATEAPKDREEFARLAGEQRAIGQVAAAKGCPSGESSAPGRAAPSASAASGAG